MLSRDNRRCGTALRKVLWTERRLGAGSNGWSQVAMWWGVSPRKPTGVSTNLQQCQPDPGRPASGDCAPSAPGTTEKSGVSRESEVDLAGHRTQRTKITGNLEKRGLKKHGAKRPVSGISSVAAGIQLWQIWSNVLLAPSEFRVVRDRFFRLSRICLRFLWVRRLLHMFALLSSRTPCDLADRKFRVYRPLPGQNGDLR